MLRSTIRKVAWVGRTTSTVFGLALILALIFGVATMALGANGKPFLLGKKNVATAVSTLVKKGAGPALSLKVGSGAPLAVNSSKKVTNLNADQVDGKDSRTFGAYMATSHDIIASCTSPSTWTKCASHSITVPAGKVYHVTVWSSLNASAGQAGHLQYCPAVEGGSYELTCITPTVNNSWPDWLDLPAFFTESAASSGEISLPAGTYTISTAIDPSVTLSPSSYTKVNTTLMVQDGSAPLPPTQ